MKIKKEIFFYYPVLQKGGILTTLIIYANYLSDKYKIKIFTSCKNKELFKKFNSHIEIININKKKFNNLFIILAIYRFKNKHTIIFSMQNHFLILLINKIFFNNKIIIRTSSIIPNRKNFLEVSNYKNITIKKIIIRFYHLASYIITFSKDNVAYFKSLGMINSSCVYNFFQKETPKLFKKKKILDIFFIGRFTFEKDPLFFLENLIAIPKINIHLVGDGSLLKKLKILSSNEKNVFFHKYTESPIKFFKNKIDLLCITSKYEGTPNIMGEAMSCSIPVLAPAEIGLTKLFLKNGQLGYLYKLNSPSSFKDKVMQVIENHSVAVKKARKAHKSINRFSLNKTLYKIDKIISKI